MPHPGKKSLNLRGGWFGLTIWRVRKKHKLNKVHMRLKVSTSSLICHERPLSQPNLFLPIPVPCCLWTWPRHSQLLIDIHHGAGNFSMAFPPPVEKCYFPQVFFTDSRPIVAYDRCCIWQMFQFWRRVSYCHTAYSFVLHTHLGSMCSKIQYPVKNCLDMRKKIIGFLYDRYYLVVSKNRGKTPQNGWWK